MEQNFSEYLKNLKTHGQQNNIPNVSETVGKLLNMLIKIHRPKMILEIGSANGYSTLWMAEAARCVGAKIHTIDHSRPTFEKLLANLSEAGFGDTVEPHFGKAIPVIESFPEALKFDFIFVDGEKASYLDFWHAIQPRLADWAVVAFDDMIAFPQKTTPFRTFLNQLEGWEWVLLPADEDDGVLLMRKI